MILARLIFEFFKTGLFSFGGGLATIPFLQQMSAATGWFTLSQLADMIAVSESTPGPIGVNMATYVGFVTAGIPGGVLATLGLIAPPITLMLIVSRILRQFRDSRLVQAAFTGLRPASVGLISAAGLAVIKLSLLSLDAYRQTGAFVSLIRWRELALAAVLFVLMRRIKAHPIFFLFGSALVGIILGF